RPGVAAAAVDPVVLDDGDDARLRQIKQPEGDYLVSGSAIAVLELKQVVPARRRIRGEPGSRNKQVPREQARQGRAQQRTLLGGAEAEALQQRRLDVLADHLRRVPLLRLGCRGTGSLFSGRLLSASPPRLVEVKAQVPSQGNGIDRRTVHTGLCQ